MSARRSIDQRAGHFQQDGTIVESRLGDYTLRQLVEDPSERSAGWDAELRLEIVAVDGELVPAQDDVRGQLSADPRLQFREVPRLCRETTAFVVGGPKCQQVVDGSRADFANEAPYGGVGPAAQQLGHTRVVHTRVGRARAGRTS